MNLHECSRLLAKESCLLLNTKIIKELGLGEAIMLAELAFKHDYCKWAGYDICINDDYFPIQTEEIYKYVKVRPDDQRIILENLQDAGLISVKRKGNPAKQYVKINKEELEDFIDGASF